MMLTFLDLKDKKEKTVSEVVKRHLSASVFYFGEIHVKSDVLQVQLEMLRELSRHGPLVLGLEMFNVTQQELLDSYMNGSLSMEELNARYEEGPEGFPLDHYGKLLDLAKELGIAVKALIIPRNIASMVVRHGLSVLRQPQNDEIFSYLDDYVPGSKKHEEYFTSLIRDSVPMMKTGFSINRFFEAQVLKDSSMARSIVNILEETTWKSKILVITGHGHVDYRFGIPERVEALLNRDGKIVNDVVITTSVSEEQVTVEKFGRKIADYLFVTRDELK